MKELSWRFVQLIDALTERVKICGFLIVIMTFVVAYEVVARYVFNNPTKWAWGVNEQLLCAMVIIGGSFALLHGTHVRADLVYKRWSTRSRAIVDLCTSFLPILFCGVVVYGSAKLAWRSLVNLERVSAYFEPPLYPLRVLVLIGVILFLFQVLANFVRNVLVLTGRR